MHRDFKLANFLLDKTMQLQLCDFGLAVQLESYDEHKHSFCGPPHFMAPEMANPTRQGHSFEMEVWAFGVVLYIMLTGSPPFVGKDVAAIKAAIYKGQINWPKDN